MISAIKEMNSIIREWSGKGTTLDKVDREWPLWGGNTWNEIWRVAAIWEVGGSAQVGKIEETDEIGGK